MLVQRIVPVLELARGVINELANSTDLRMDILRTIDVNSGSQSQG